MFKNTLTLLGIGLIALWIVGLSVNISTPYMTWLDGVGGLLCFILAGSIPDTATAPARSVPIVVLSLCLFGLWIGGLVSAAVTWQVWWTFVAACLCLLIGVGSSINRPSARGMGGTTEDHERPRRVA